MAPAPSTTESTAAPAPAPMSFEDFHEDVQLLILSFLTPDEISSFASTSRHFAAFCSQPKLWHSMCNRRWGSRTRINSWAGGNARSGNMPFSLLYEILHRWENLIGFWRRVGSEASATPPLLFFEWGPSFITGYSVTPSTKTGGYDVRKTPFLWMGLSTWGEAVVLLQNGCRYQSEDDLLKVLSGSSCSNPELVPVNVSFAGSNYFILKENSDLSSHGGTGDRFGASEESMSASPPDRLMSEIYQYLANRTSPGADRAWRRQRRRERGRLGRRKLTSEHFIKITDCYPTPSRPFQGLWKGICENKNLDFYLVIYDDIGGIVCRRVCEPTEPCSGYSPVFWTSNTNFLEHPFKREEYDIYINREHIQPTDFNCSNTVREEVYRILCINSCCDLVMPGLPASSDNLHNMEGRIWEYKSGTFGFGFLQNEFIVDLKHIALNGCLLDAVEDCNDTSLSYSLVG